MSRTIKLSVQLNAAPEKLYNAWLNSEEHSRFTGAEAVIENKIGGEFSAWDGYIEGTTNELYPNTKIVQAWRTTDFPDGSPDSRLEILLEPEGEMTMLTLVHSGIPEGMEKEFEHGWLDYYFEPMKNYYSNVK